MTRVVDADTPFDWGDHEVPADEAREVRLGPLALRFVRSDGEVRIACRRAGDAADEPEWSRWVPGDTFSGRIRFTPAHPDRLVVVGPGTEFRLLRRARARIYVRLPVHVHVQALEGAPSDLLSVPTTIMSDTWWGTPEEGELGYWLETHARRHMREEEFEEHLCICPLDLENHSGNDLTVDRIALRVAHLSIYRAGQRLWADETRVRYRGEDAGSEIDMAGRPPPEAPEATRIAAPASPRGRSFTARTFARLRSSLEGWL